MGSARDLCAAALLLAAGCGKVITNQPDGAPIDSAARPDAMVPDAMPVDPFINGSFESGDYSGWTLNEDSGTPTNGLWGIGNSGDQLTPTTVAHDYFDNMDFTPGCFTAGTTTLQSSDGVKVAYNAQGGAERHRMWQDITVPAGLPTLSWSMSYANANTAFDLTTQFLAVEVRDPATDTITATLFTTDPTTNPPQTIPMTAFQADLSAYVGQHIRITVDLQAQSNCLFGSFDGFALH